MFYYILVQFLKGENKKRAVAYWLVDGKGSKVSSLFQLLYQSSLLHFW